MKPKIILIVVMLCSTLSIYGQQDSTHRLEEYLTAGQIDTFKTVTLAKVNELGTYIITITNKNINDEKLKQSAINLACKLFASEACRVEVSSLNVDAKKSFLIRDYLVRIKVLNYSKVIIQWYDIRIVSDFHKGPDGRYYGVVTICQKFEGYRDEMLIYKDVTHKNIEVVIDWIQIEEGDKVFKRLDVFLGDIYVTETKP